MVSREDTTDVVNRLLEEYLALSASGLMTGSGGVELIKEKFDLRELLLTVQVSLQPTFAAARQTLQLSLAEQPLMVDADRTRLLQVFTNLLTNANKYTPEGGLIEIESHRAVQRVFVSVRIRAHSEGPGKGTELIVELPACVLP